MKNMIEVILEFFKYDKTFSKESQYTILGIRFFSWHVH